MAIDRDIGEEVETQADARADADPRRVEIGAPAPTPPELVAFIDALAAFAADLYLAGVQPEGAIDFPPPKV